MLNPGSPASASKARASARIRRRRSCITGMGRSEEHTSELQSLKRISYAVFFLKKKIKDLQKLSQQLTKSNNKKVIINITVSTQTVVQKVRIKTKNQNNTQVYV